MWWEPQNEQQRRLTETLNRIEENFASPKLTIPAVYGFGSSGNSEVRRPIVQLDSAFAPPWLGKARSPTSDKREDPQTGPQYQRSRFVVSLGEAGRDAQNVLAPWALPADTEVAFCEPIRPSLRPAAKIWAGRKTATLGLPFWVEGGTNGPGRYAFTTVGHLVDRAPTVVSVHEGLWRERRIGSVLHFNDPVDQPGVDAAAVDLWLDRDIEPLPYLLGWPFMRDLIPHWTHPALLPQAVKPFQPALLHGARSGSRRGWTEGSAFRRVRSYDGRTWINTWAVMEIENGFAAPGDSGGVVTIRGDAAHDVPLGHLVCGTGIARRSERFQIGLVQDAATIWDYLAAQYNSRIWAPRFYTPLPEPPTVRLACAAVSWLRSLMP